MNRVVSAVPKKPNFKSLGDFNARENLKTYRYSRLLKYCLDEASGKRATS